MSEKPRQQHYVFAHKALPQIIHSDPDKALQLLAGPEGEGFLPFFWRRVAERERIPAADQLPPRGLARTVRIEPDGTVAVVITMPPPERYAEASFVAAVFTPGPRKLLEPPGAKAGEAPRSVRVFTLEKAAPIDPEVITYLCEWTSAGRHENHGPGPKPEEAAFIQALLQHLGAEVRGQPHVDDETDAVITPDPAEPAHESPLIETEERARRLARAMASDLLLYNKEKIVQGIQTDEIFTALAEEIEEGRALYKSRVSPELYQKDIYDQALVDMLGHFTPKTPDRSPKSPESGRAVEQRSDPTSVDRPDVPPATSKPDRPVPRGRASMIVGITILLLLLLAVAVTLVYSKF